MVSISHSVKCLHLHLATITWTFILFRSWAEFDLTAKIYKPVSESKMLIRQVMSCFLFFMGRFFITNSISLIDTGLFRFFYSAFFLLRVVVQWYQLEKKTHIFIISNNKEVKGSLYKNSFVKIFPFCWKLSHHEHKAKNCWSFLVM